jgi:hypothetical protein
VRPAVTPQMNVASVEFEEPSLVWEFRSVATNDIKFIKAAEANAFLESPPPLCLVVPTSDLKSGMVSLPGDAQTFRATGYDTTKLRFWDVTAVIRR